MTAPPRAPWLTWYGDDFTGSTDALETLAANGLRAVLFLDIPTAADLRRFPGAQAIGLAGASRSHGPQWMSQHLPPAFEWLRGLGAPLCHYKVCSTFDSSPTTGNIGRAIEIGRDVFHAPLVPVIAGAPALGRYTVFGNLFAASGDAVYRIDRHPVMSCHPVTPMHEADLLRHLARQTPLRTALVSLPQMLAGEASPRLRHELQQGTECVLLDVFDPRSTLEAGLALWPPPGPFSPFAAGSSGVEHALVAAWKQYGLLPAPAPSPPTEPADRIVVLSGSCSPGTWSQIRYAIDHGYAAFHVDPQPALASPDAFDTIAAEALAALRASRSVVLYTSLDHTSHWLAALPEHHRNEARQQLGARCGRLLRQVLQHSGVRRAVVAGGDTSSHAGRQLDLVALAYRAPLALGAPLCLAISVQPQFDGLEIVFKGGQIGAADFFELARTGRA